MLFGICPRTSSTPKLWYMYVITYSDYMVIVNLANIEIYYLLWIVGRGCAVCAVRITNLRNKCFLVHSPAPTLYSNYKLLDWSPLKDCHQEPLGDLSIQRKFGNGSSTCYSSFSYVIMSNYHIFLQKTSE